MPYFIGKSAQLTPALRSPRTSGRSLNSAMTMEKNSMNTTTNPTEGLRLARRLATAASPPPAAAPVAASADAATEEPRAAAARVGAVVVAVIAKAAASCAVRIWV